MEIKFYSPSIDDKLKNNESFYNNLDCVNIGNPISVYSQGKERDLFSFYIKPCVLSIFLTQIIQNRNKKITIFDLGCGTGTNARIISKGIFDNIDKNTFIKIVFIDVSSELLKEAEQRTSSFRDTHGISLEWELVQLDLTNIEDLYRFSDDYKASADFVFSIKFLHNTKIKIDKNISRFLSSILRSNGIFLNQFYCHKGFGNNLKTSLKYFLGRDYGNSSIVDRYFANKFLASSGFVKQYSVEQKCHNQSLELNHFFQYAIEIYWQKYANL